MTTFRVGWKKLLAASLGAYLGMVAISAAFWIPLVLDTYARLHSVDPDLLGVETVLKGEEGYSYRGKLWPPLLVQVYRLGPNIHAREIVLYPPREPPLSSFRPALPNERRIWEEIHGTVLNKR